MTNDQKSIRHVMITRLIHEIANPLGTLYNALEVLEDDLDTNALEQSLTLAKKSVDRLRTRLGFYALTYGDHAHWDDLLVTRFLSERTHTLKAKAHPSYPHLTLNLIAFLAERAPKESHITVSDLSVELKTPVSIELDFHLNSLNENPLEYPRDYQAFLTHSIAAEQKKKWLHTQEQCLHSFKLINLY